MLAGSRHGPEGVPIRSRTSVLVAAAVLVAGGLTGCGTNSRSNGSDASAPNLEVTRLPVASLDSDSTQLAASDGEHGFAIELSAGREQRLIGASVITPDEPPTAAPSLPELLQAQIFPRAEGFALFGYECVEEPDPEDIQAPCGVALPTALWLSPDGETKAAAQGEEVPWWQIGRARGTSADGVLLGLGEGRFAVLTPEGQTELEVPGNTTDVCPLRSGGTAAVAVDSANEVTSDAPAEVTPEDAPAEVSYWLQVEGTDIWGPLGDPIVVSNELGDTAYGDCVVGGLVNDGRILFDSRGAFEIPALAGPDGALVQVVGITSGGNVLLQPGPNRGEPSLISAPSGEVNAPSLAGASLAAVGWDGSTLLSVSEGQVTFTKTK